MSKSERQRRENLGRRAERLAALYLRFKGYKVLAERFKTKSGEIDIIARRKDVIVIIEVKARKNLTVAQEAISADSKGRIQRAAQIYLAKNPKLQTLGLRYDAIFVTGGWRVSHEQDFWR